MSVSAPSTTVLVPQSVLKLLQSFGDVGSAPAGCRCVPLGSSLGVGACALEAVNRCCLGEQPRLPALPASALSEGAAVAKAASRFLSKGFSLAKRPSALNIRMR